MPRWSIGGGRWTRLADIGIAGLACVVIWQFVSGPPKRAVPPQMPPVQVGSVLSLPGILWGEAEVNVVLAFTTACQYCLASGPLYERLAAWSSKEASRRLIVMSPESGSVLMEWFSKQGVHQFQLVQDNFLLYGFRRTPMIAFVNPTGMVTDVAVGKLSDDDEVRLFARLNGTLAGPLAIRPLSETNNRDKGRNETPTEGGAKDRN